jgi:hypothetical protein
MPGRLSSYLLGKGGAESQSGTGGEMQSASGGSSEVAGKPAVMQSGGGSKGGRFRQMLQRFRERRGGSGGGRFYGRMKDRISRWRSMSAKFRRSGG